MLGETSESFSELGVGVVGGAADVLEAPGEGADEAVVVRLPAAGFVAVDAAREPVHFEKVYS